MTIRLGINGFGRTCLRAALNRAEAGTQDVEVVAVNDIAPPATLAHLLEYDSTFGHIGREVSHDDSSITVDGRRIAVTAEPGPAALQWADYGADIVVESTGRFRDRDPASCIFDPALTQANGTLVKLFGWYDNEWGHTNRLPDLTALVADD
jgi:glyceraldehyde 3-phosphate dehydrogenase